MSDNKALNQAIDKAEEKQTEEAIKKQAEEMKAYQEKLTSVYNNIISALDGLKVGECLHLLSAVEGTVKKSSFKK